MKTIPVQDKFIRPCPEYPQGAWFRKIGNGPWEKMDDQCPIAFIPTAKETYTMKQAYPPRRFHFFFEPTIADPTNSVPVVEILPQHLQIYFTGVRAHLVLWIVKLLLPKHDERAVPMHYTPESAKTRKEYMEQVAALINSGGPKILSVSGTYPISAEEFFIYHAPLDEWRPQYGEAMLRAAYEALHQRFRKERE